ncbi:MAG: hypothetical protein QOG15_3648 [Solirubrobacteraceae bacterium]|nr:hypothetical protein [Solirubrobacteraceae bacterium]
MAASVLALGLVACGDDGGGSATGPGTGTSGTAGAAATAGDDKAQIARAIKLAFTTQNGNVSCKQLGTKAFVARVYGTLAHCLAVEAKNSDKPPDDVRVSNINATGDTGSAHTQFVGGDADGTAGTVDMRKESGNWRVDDLGADLLRSVLTIGLSSELKGDKTFRKPVVRGCVTKAITDLPDAQLKQFAYDAMGDKKGDSALAKLVAPCLTKPGSGGGSSNRSFVREKFEQGIEQTLSSSGVPRTTITCIEKKLRTSISDADLGKLSTSGGKTTPALQKAVVAALVACRSQPGSTSQSQ